jgi:hypothetical protein
MESARKSRERPAERGTVPRIHLSRDAGHCGLPGFVEGQDARRNAAGMRENAAAGCMDQVR